VLSQLYLLFGFEHHKPHTSIPLSLCANNNALNCNGFTCFLCVTNMFQRNLQIPDLLILLNVSASDPLQLGHVVRHDGMLILVSNLDFILHSRSSCTCQQPYLIDINRILHVIELISNYIW
jgi:hypothetical protein